MSHQVNIDEFLSQAGHSDGKKHKKQELALQSFAKRCKYGEILFGELAPFLEPICCLRARIDADADADDIRLRFETFLVAYIGNAHALIDSFPFLVRSTLDNLKTLNKQQKRVEIADHDAGWDERFLDALKDTYKDHIDFINQFESMHNDSLLKQLKGISNTSKHRFLPRIRSTGTCWKYEKTTRDNRNKILCEDVIEFLREVDAKVLPGLFILVNELQKVAASIK